MDKATADTILADSTVILAVATLLLMIAATFLAWFTRLLTQYTKTLSKLTARLVAIEEQRDRREQAEQRRADLTKCVASARTIWRAHLDPFSWNTVEQQGHLKEVIPAVEELLALSRYIGDAETISTLKALRGFLDVIARLEPAQQQAEAAELNLPAMTKELQNRLAPQIDAWRKELDQQPS
jgi:hypothetical protein